MNAMTLQVTEPAQIMETIQIEAENIGGLLGKTRLELKHGVNIIEAPNASGKTSILGAFTLSVLPSREVSQYAHILHSAETKGSVKLIFNNEKIERIIKKEKKKEPEISGGSIASDDTLGLIRRFAIADENNPVLVRIRSGENLRDVLTEYSGVDVLRAQHKKLIEKESLLQDELRQYTEKVNRVGLLKKNLKELEQKHEELEIKKKELYGKSPEKEETGLVELEGEIARTESNLKNAADSIKAAESAIKSREERLKAIDQHISGGIEEIIKQIEAKELDKKAIEENKKELVKVELLRSNELTHLRFIDENIQIYAASHEEPDKLKALISDEEQTIICPVCDHSTKYGRIKVKLKKIAEDYKRVLSQAYELNEKIKKLSLEINGLKARKDEIESMRTERKRTLEDLEIRKKQLSQKIDSMKALEDRLKKFKEQKKKVSEERTKEVSEYEGNKIEVEKEIAITINSIENLNKELKILKPAALEIKEIEKKLTNTKNKIKALAEEIEEREKGIIRIFNTEIKNIYTKMGFEKINELHLDDNFNLRVVRLSKTGAGYSDTVKSLSKTEKEVAGLILLLSGYRAFKIGEKYPFFVIDEISFMDTQRLTTFIDHIKETAARSIVIMTIPGRKIELSGVTRVPLSV